ncbi:Forkhead box protein J3 [Tulasnella sp. JGI-2019a]|nr:Forkhead box protein J3 [Tulasnella sp. JGI-2019a]
MSPNNVRASDISASGPRSSHGGQSSAYSPPSTASSAHGTPPTGLQPSYPTEWIPSSQAPITGSAVGPMASSTAPSRRTMSEADTYRGLTLADLADPEPGNDPGYSKRALIQVAIQSSANQRLRQSEIREAIMERFPFFRTAGKTWQHSLRHALTNNKCFYKVPRLAREPGRGAYWAYEYVPKSRAVARVNPTRRMRIDRPTSPPGEGAGSSSQQLQGHEVSLPNAPAQSMRSEAGHFDPSSIPLPSPEPTPVYFPTDLPLFFGDDVVASGSTANPRFPSLTHIEHSSGMSSHHASLFPGSATMGEETPFLIPSTTIAPAQRSNYSASVVSTSPPQDESPSRQQHPTAAGRSATGPGFHLHATHTQPQPQQRMTYPFVTSPFVYPDMGGPSQAQAQPQYAPQDSFVPGPFHLLSEPSTWTSTASHQQQLSTYDYQHQQRIAQPQQQFQISPSVAVRNALGDVGYARLSNLPPPLSLASATAEGLRSNISASSASTSHVPHPQLRNASSWQANLPPPPGPSTSNLSSGGAGLSYSLDSGSVSTSWDARGATQWSDSLSFDWNAEQPQPRRRG